MIYVACDMCNDNKIKGNDWKSRGVSNKFVITSSDVGVPSTFQRFLNNGDRFLAKNKHLFTAGAYLAGGPGVPDPCPFTLQPKLCTRKEIDRKENAWRAVEQFLSVFIWTIRDQAILWETTFFFINFAKKCIMQITWNAILYHWQPSPAINYSKLLISILFYRFPKPTSFFLFFRFAPEDNNKTTSLKQHFFIWWIHSMNIL